MKEKRTIKPVRHGVRRWMFPKQAEVQHELNEFILAGKILNSIKRVAEEGDNK